MQEPAHDAANIQGGRALLRGHASARLFPFRVRRCSPDSAWKGGRFSSHPDVPALLVEKRFGLGRSLKGRHPPARLFLMGIVLPLLHQSAPGLPPAVRLAGDSHQMEEGIRQ